MQNLRPRFAAAALGLVACQSAPSTPHSPPPAAPSAQTVSIAAPVASAPAVPLGRLVYPLPLASPDKVTPVLVDDGVWALTSNVKGNATLFNLADVNPVRVGQAPHGGQSAIVGPYLVSGYRDLNVIDRHSLAPRWSIDFAPSFWTGDAVIANDTLIAFTSGSSSAKDSAGRPISSRPEMVALDAATGAPRWRTPWKLGRSGFDEQAAFAVSALGDRLFVIHAGDGGKHGTASDAALAAIDVATGREIWRRKFIVGDAEPGRVFARKNVLYVGYSSGYRPSAPEKPSIRVLDQATGRETARVPSEPPAAKPGWIDPEPFFTVDAAGDTAYISDAGLAAVDLATNRERWRVARPVAYAELRGSDSHTSMVITKRRVFVCAHDLTMRAVDRASGVTTWSMGVERCPAFAVAGTDAAPRLFMQDDALHFVSFGLDDAPVEEADIDGTATLKGDPMANAEVRVGDAVVQTGADGQFHATVRTHGLVHIDGYHPEVVEVPDDENAEARCDEFSGGTADLVLDGHSPYTVKLEVNQRCW